jgi:hypothetical protein
MVKIYDVRSEIQRRHSILSRIPDVVMWPITRRGFGLDTGFIGYGDLQLLQGTITETTTALEASWILLTGLHWRFTSRTALFCFQRLTDVDSLTHWFRRLNWRRLTSEADGRGLTNADSRDWLTKTDSLWFQRLSQTNCCLLYITPGGPDSKCPPYCWFLW